MLNCIHNSNQTSCFISYSLAYLHLILLHHLQQKLGIADALTANTAPINKNYDCSLPGLESFTPGQYEGIKVNYLSFATETSSPNFPIRAAELEACTGGTIAFAEAENVWEDPLADLGSGAVKGFELYDG